MIICRNCSQTFNLDDDIEEVESVKDCPRCVPEVSEES